METSAPAIDSIGASDTLTASCSYDRTYGKASDGSNPLAVGSSSQSGRDRGNDGEVTSNGDSGHGSGGSGSAGRAYQLQQTETPENNYFLAGCSTTWPTTSEAGLVVSHLTLNPVASKTSPAFPPAFSPTPFSPTSSASPFTSPFASPSISVPSPSKRLRQSFASPADSSPLFPASMSLPNLASTSGSATVKPLLERRFITHRSRQSKREVLAAKHVEASGLDTDTEQELDVDVDADAYTGADANPDVITPEHMDFNLLIPDIPCNIQDLPSVDNLIETAAAQPPLPTPPSSHGVLGDSSKSPLGGADDSYHAAYQRRMLALQSVGEKTSQASTVDEFWRAAQQALSGVGVVIPFGLLYVVTTENHGHEDGSKAAPSSRQQLRAVLKGLLGDMPPGHPAAVPELDVWTSSEGFAPYMRQALQTTSGTTHALGHPLVSSVETGSLPAALAVGSLQGFPGQRCSATVFAIPRLSCSPSQSIAGFVVLGSDPSVFPGLNRFFADLVAQQLATSLATIDRFTAEAQRNEDAVQHANQDRLALTEQLQICMQQVAEGETKFLRMAEFTPVGMFVADASGTITYCNDMWRKLSRHPRPAATTATTATTAVTAVQLIESRLATTAETKKRWMDSVEDEDRPELERVWNRLVQEKTAVTHEFRFKPAADGGAAASTAKHVDTSATTDTADATTTWVLLRAFPEKEELTGELKSIFGCITDISQQKLAEVSQSQRHQEAVELKRQQENFIDITSHEMRNPLSAILQSVDEIANSIEAYWERGEGRDVGRSGSSDASGASLGDGGRRGGGSGELLESILEASATISLCASHQKRIIDDVLTLSKLDSQLLVVRPVSVQPITVVRNTIRMFEAELQAHAISCEFSVQPSFQALVGRNGSVRLDPSRLSQVLINLLTNAIKFTQASDQRAITITLDASVVDDKSDEMDTMMAKSGVQHSDHVDHNGHGSHDSHDGAARPRFHYFAPPSRQQRPQAEMLFDGPDWGSGPMLHLHVAVTDTGIGLQDDEKTVLFRRFSQASPRTHVQYGGSGLGLFISRNLTELQGGQIGVTSTVGRGSTFAFYIKCRKDETHGDEDGPRGLASSTLPAQFAPFLAYPLSGSEGRKSSKPSFSSTAGGSAVTQSTTAVRPETLAATATATAAAKLAAVTAASAASATSARLATAATATTKSTALAAAAALRQTAEPLDVLIVEDNLVNQRVLQRQLDRSGNRTQVANHGGEALQALRQSRFWQGSVASEPAEKAADVGEVAYAMELDRATPVPAQTSNSRPVSSMSTVSAKFMQATPSPSSTAATAATAAVSNPPQQQHQPPTNISVILMDLEMPVMDGMTCARAIRELEQTGQLAQHVPIIAVTAYARPEQIEKAKAAGIDDVISKPFQMVQLLPKMRELVGKYHMLT